MAAADNPIQLEVCVARRSDAVAAAAGGADRLELNTALELGGLTPSVGLLDEVKQAVSIPLLVMLRPRPAGFVYDASELQTLYSDAVRLLDHGADGIVFGVLARDGSVHRQACQRLIDLAAGRETVFHRALDVVPDVLAAAAQLANLGVTRILTSGQAETALAGASCIARLQQAVGTRLQVVAAAGITASNVQQVLRLTGCRQIHGSFSASGRDEAGVVGGSEYRYTCEAKVRAAREAIDALWQRR